MHLQCHIGTDTLSLRRLGDLLCTGVGAICWLIVTALMDAGLRLTMLVEHDSVPWNGLPGRMEELPGGEYRLGVRRWRLAHSYTVQATKV